MSRTYRKRRYSSQWMRSPKGRVNALINHARKAAVPPDPWDDYFLRGENSTPDRIICRLLEQGANPLSLAKKISKKFNIRIGIAVEMVVDTIRMIENRKIYRWYSETKKEKQQRLLVENLLKGMAVDELSSSLLYLENMKKSAHVSSVSYTYTFIDFDDRPRDVVKTIPLGWALECFSEILEKKIAENTPQIISGE